MKMKKLNIVTAVAFAAIGLVSTSASAANLDLILGFEITDPGTTSQGSATNLELDLGPASSLTPGVLSSLIGNDLSTVYGTSWATRTDLSWGVAGITTSGGINNYHFDSTSTTGAQTDVSASAIHPAYNGVAALGANIGSGSATGAANTSGAVTLGTGTTGSWTYQISDAGGSSVQGAPYFTTPSSETTVDGTKTADQSIELYNYGPGSSLGTDLGTFTLAGSGTSATFSFAAVAAPEPSAYALGICAVLLFVVLKRRSSIA